MTPRLLILAGLLLLALPMSGAGAQSSTTVPKKTTPATRSASPADQFRRWVSDRPAVHITSSVMPSDAPEKPMATRIDS